MSQLVIGLSGNIGSGKSTVSDLFKERGIVIADADVASREIMMPGQPAYDAVVERWGQDVLQDNQELDRAAIRGRVFADQQERRWLESQTVGRIMERLQQVLQEAQSPFSMLVLSTGRGRNPLTQRTLVVDVSPATQIERVTARDNNTEEQVRAIMAVQPSREERLSWADDVIVNEGPIAAVEAEVDRLYNEYLKLAEAAWQTS